MRFNPDSAPFVPEFSSSRDIYPKGPLLGPEADAGMKTQAQSETNGQNKGTRFCQAIFLYYACGCRTKDPVYCCKPALHSRPSSTPVTPGYGLCEHENITLVVGSIPVSCKALVGLSAACMAEDPATGGFIREVDTADKLETLLVLGECPKSDLEAALPRKVGRGSLLLENDIRTHYQQIQNPSAPKPSLDSQTYTTSFYDQTQKQLELPGDPQEQREESEENSLPIGMGVNTDTAIEPDTNSLGSQPTEADNDQESDSQSEESEELEEESAPDIMSDDKGKCELPYSASVGLVNSTGNNEDVTLDVETPDNAVYTVDDDNGVAIDMIDFLDKSEFHSELGDGFQDEQHSTEGFWKRGFFRVW